MPAVNYDEDLAAIQDVEAWLRRPPVLEPEPPPRTIQAEVIEAVVTIAAPYCAPVSSPPAESRHSKLRRAYAAVRAHDLLDPETGRLIASRQAEFAAVSRAHALQSVPARASVLADIAAIEADTALVEAEEARGKAQAEFNEARRARKEMD